MADLCAWCGKPFVRKPKAHNQKYCSKKCHSAIVRQETRSPYKYSSRDEFEKTCAKLKKEIEGMPKEAK